MLLIRSLLAVAVLLTSSTAFGEDGTEKQKQPAAQPDQPKAKDGWSKVKSSKGKFSVEFPAKTKSQQQNQPTAAGNMTLHAEMCETNGGKVAHMVMWNSLPAAITNVDPSLLLNGGKQGLMGGTRNAKLISESDDDFRGNPAKRLVIKGGMPVPPANKVVDAKIDVQIVIHDNKLYQIMVVESQGATVTEKDRKRFYDSFKFNTAKKPEKKQDE